MCIFDLHFYLSHLSIHVLSSLLFEGILGLVSFLKMSSQKISLKGSFGRGALSHSRNPKNSPIASDRGGGGRNFWDNEDATERGIELCPRRHLN